MTDPVTVSVVITNYNGASVLPATLESLKQVKGPIVEVIVVDDGSTDASLGIVKERFPSVIIVPLGKNTARVNQVRNEGLRRATGSLVFLVDNDILFDPECLIRLIEAWKAFDRAALLTPRLLYADDREKIYTDGQRLHYVGSSIARNRNARNAAADVLENSMGGGIVLVDRAKAASVDFFNEAYRFGWGEDGDLFYRLLMAGHKSYHVPSAVCLHYSKDRTTQRAYAQVYNRWMYLLENYAARTLLVLSPAFLVYEMMLFSFLAMKGAAGDYARANLHVLRDLRFFMARRRVTQARRKVSDRELMTSGEMYVAPSLLGNPVLRLGIRALNAFFDGYWRLAKSWL